MNLFYSIESIQLTKGLSFLPWCVEQMEQTHSTSEDRSRARGAQPNIKSKQVYGKKKKTLLEKKNRRFPHLTCVRSRKPSKKASRLANR